jgi:DNA polymerase III alpha subunit
MPNEKERKKMFWGQRYANVNFETKTGEQERVKFDFDVYNDARLVLEEGKGTPIIFHAIPNRQYRNLRADLIIDLAKLKTNIEEAETLNLWENLLIGNHLSKEIGWKNNEIRRQRLTNEQFFNNKLGGVFCGIITHVKPKYDKNGNKMAFIGILGVENHIEVVCFSSAYKNDKKKFVVGNLVVIAIEKQKRGKEISYIYNGGGVRVK